MEQNNAATDNVAQKRGSASSPNAFAIVAGVVFGGLAPSRCCAHDETRRGNFSFSVFLVPITRLFVVFVLHCL
jgi:hypothetical protein